MKAHILLLAAALSTTGASAQSTPESGMNDPHKPAEGSWVGITGHVESVSPGSFMMDYGDGTIKVDLEPSSTKKHDFIQNEKVRVFGVVDDGFFTGRTIKAHAVYVESLQTYACTTDGSETAVAAFAPTIFSGVVVNGRVTEVVPGSVKVDEGGRLIEIDTSKLTDANGKVGVDPAVKVGDRVTVVAHMDEGLFTRKLQASSLEVDR